MTDKELQRLRREDLLQILIGQQKQIQDLTEALESAEAALADKRIKLENAGSIAEAALQLNDVFEAAQRAADNYLAEAKAQADETLAQARAKLEEAERKAREAEDALARARSQAQRSPEPPAAPAPAEEPRKGLFGRGKRV